MPILNRINITLKTADSTNHLLFVNTARTLLNELIVSILKITTMSESAHWAIFLLQEQVHPTEAFLILHESVIQAIEEKISRLITIIKDSKTKSYIKLRNFLLLKSLLVTCNMRSSLLKEMNWGSLSPINVHELENVVLELLSEI